MSFVRFSLRIPDQLHEEIANMVELDRKDDPGVSLNSWILQAMREKRERDMTHVQEPAPSRG